MIKINCENLIMGRVATYVAKEALKGETIELYNCSKIVILGEKSVIVAHYKRLRNLLMSPTKGPYIHTSPLMIMKRCIKRMVPFKEERGKLALKRIKCYNMAPESKENLVSLEKAYFNGNSRFITLEELSKGLR